MGYIANTLRKNQLKRKNNKHIKNRFLELKAGNLFFLDI